MQHLNYKKIHRLYCDLTGREMPCTMAMHFAWEKWHSMGWGEDDLRLVVQHINGLIKKDRRRPESFRFCNLIGDTERFLEDISEVKALNRVTRVDPSRAAVLRATGRSVEAPSRPVMTPDQIMEQHKVMSESLRAFRESM